MGHSIKDQIPMDEKALDEVDTMLFVNKEKESLVEYIMKHPLSEKIKDEI